MLVPVCEQCVHVPAPITCMCAVLTCVWALSCGGVHVCVVCLYMSTQAHGHR